MAGVMGFSCALTEGAAPHTLGKAQDVDLTINGEPVDISTRSGAGFKEFAEGMIEADISVDQLWLASDTAYVDITAAILARTVLAFSMLDGVGGKGWSGNMIITSVGMKQPLKGALTCPIKAKVTGTITQV